MIKCKVTKKNYAGTRNRNGIFNRSGSNVDYGVYCYYWHIASIMVGT